MEFAPTIVEKLRERAARFHELTEQLADPDVASNPKRLTTTHSSEGPQDDPTPLSGSRAERYQVVLHVEAATLHRAGEPGRSDLEDPSAGRDNPRR